MRQIKQFILGIGAMLAVAVLVSPIALADAETACKGANYAGTAAQACQTGYNAKDKVACNPYRGSQLLSACEKGAELGIADAQQSGGNTNQNGNTNTNNNGQQGNNTQTQTGPGECGGTKTGVVSCAEDSGIAAIGGLIKLAVTILTVIIGIVAVGGIAYAAILYASARDNQSQVQNAIGIIRNIVIGLVMYGFTIAIVNWLVPGGVIG